MSGALWWEACAYDGRGAWFVRWTNCPNAVVIQHSTDLRTWVDETVISKVNPAKVVGDFEHPLRMEDEAVFYRLRTP